MLGNSRRNVRPVAVAADAKKTTVAKASTAAKRQGDSLQDPTQKRRAAFGDITNALTDKSNIKVALKKSKLPAPASQLPKPTFPAPKVNKENKTVKKEKKVKSNLAKVPSTDALPDESVLSLLSQDSNGSSSQDSNNSSADISCKGVEDLIPLDEEKDEKEDNTLKDIDNVDAENMQDPVQVALYAWDIFEYYKEREVQFHVAPYMAQQKFITVSMRSILVDWLVEVQENFELNHETLYLAVKLVDMYASRTSTPKESLQLIGAVSLFIASKFDERCPPLVEDFLYICDDAYKRKEFLDMERCILQTIGFDIGMPLSYRFLRRYAKCGRSNMETLTLARYILEMSLMEYDFIPKRESEMAAASLLLALKMKKAGDWVISDNTLNCEDPDHMAQMCRLIWIELVLKKYLNAKERTKTLVHYTGYKEEDLTETSKKLNKYISDPPRQLTTIRSKYSHKVFYEVAKIPTLQDSDFS